MSDRTEAATKIVNTDVVTSKVTSAIQAARLTVAPASIKDSGRVRVGGASIRFKDSGRVHVGGASIRF